MSTTKTRSEGALAGYVQQLRAQIKLLQEELAHSDMEVQRLRAENEHAQVQLARLQQELDARPGEHEVRQTRRLAAVGRLAGGVAHFFNNLLMGIDGCIDVALNKLDGEHAARKYLSEAKRAVGTGAAMTRQLLTFSRRREALRATQTLDHILLGATDMLRRLVDASIEIEVIAGAPEGKLSCLEGAVEEVLMNLVIHARDSLPEGGSLRIESGATSHGELADDAAPRYLLLRASVSDGGGVHPAGKPATHALDAVCAIVKQSGGHVEMGREPGIGTTLRLYFPKVANPS